MRRNFKSIVERVAQANAGRLMGKARVANRLAKCAQTKQTRLGAYGVKHRALLALKEKFPGEVTVSLDPQYGTYFVLVRAGRSRFGLHAPARVFAEAA
jgi:hypothetical protein